MIGENTLISRDSKGKIRVVEISYKWEDDHKGYVIRRYTSQYGGKVIAQPEIVISRGKVKRTVTEQAQLEYNSHLKKYQDKGYKLLDKSIDKYTKEELEKILPEHTTDANGIIKPMLAKDYHKVATSVLEKQYLASRKLNGVRMLLYLDEDGNIRSASRGGEDYDYSTTHIRSDERLISFFKLHPTVVLDGEVFHRYKRLQEISGAARLEKNATDCDWLQYWIYDCFIKDDINLSAEERLSLLEDWFEDERIPTFNNNENSDFIFRVPHVEVSGWSSIKKLHDQYVSEGFEGVVIREVSKPYKPNSRTNAMLKIKEYFDDTFKVIGYELGLRGSEDMTFICETKDGKTFKASPLGDRETKAEYVENFEEKYKNHLGDCKYFEYSSDGLPQQSKFLGWRFDLE